MSENDDEFDDGLSDEEFDDILCELRAIEEVNKNKKCDDFGDYTNLF